jgi:hypothetical protein
VYSSLRQSLLSSSNLSSAVGFSFLAVDSLLAQLFCRLQLVLNDRRVVPCGVFFVATVVFVIFELVFNDRLVAPCGGLFVATVVFVVFELVFCGRIFIPCSGFFVAAVSLSFSNLSTAIGLSFLAVDSLL